MTRTGRSPEASPARLLEVAEAAARAAGRHALTHYGRRGEADEVLAHDIKLALDRECQEQAAEVVRKAFPSDALLGEEGAAPSDGAARLWVIDPIDGTVNFSHGLPHWCCSVAAQQEGRTVAGAVFAPMAGELYAATEGGPALCNGHPVAVSGVASLAGAMVATGFMKRSRDASLSFAVLEALSGRVQKVRITGSAALDLCYVARGRFDGYVETYIHLWDMAAAALVVERAGGGWRTPRRWGGTAMCLVAANADLVEPLAALVRGAARAAPLRG